MSALPLQDARTETQRRPRDPGPTSKPHSRTVQVPKLALGVLKAQFTALSPAPITQNLFLLCLCLGPQNKMRQHQAGTSSLAFWPPPSPFAGCSPQVRSCEEAHVNLSQITSLLCLDSSMATNCPHRKSQNQPPGPHTTSPSISLPDSYLPSSLSQLAAMLGLRSFTGPSQAHLRAFAQAISSA